MLIELAVHDLGVIEDLSLVFGPGMTALTGETGAGKTLVVGAIELLAGGRADPGRVRPGAAEAVVEGRFLHAGDEIVLRRVVPRDGRSRAYVDGRLAPVATLAELGRELVDLHGQHAHQSLLGATTQRAALDRFGAVDLAPREDARRRRREVEGRLAALGGDARARARELDLLTYQLDEIDAAGIEDADEDRRLEREEDAVADAAAHLDAAARAQEALVGEGGAIDRLGEVVAALDDRTPFTELVARARALQADADDLARDLRGVAEGVEDDPERLAVLRSRRNLLHDLRRKYGATLADVLAFRDDAAARRDELVSHDAVVAALEAERVAIEAELDAIEIAIGGRRREAAPRLAAAAQAHLVELAMPNARLAVSVGEPPTDPAGDDVTFLLAANRGAPLAPLAKVASGGELARAMLALRLVLSLGPPVLVFDEVDAGIGGSAALAVARALRALADERQVLVVTHLPQVAAFAHQHVTVAKRDVGEVTVSEAVTLDAEARVGEISRMLSGAPDRAGMRGAAEELLALVHEEVST